MAKDLDPLEVIFYAWKLHTDQAQVLRAVQRKYQLAARLYRSKACFLALAVYAKEKRQKAALYQRLHTARCLQKVKLVTRRWRLLAASQRDKNAERLAVAVRKRAVRVLRTWKVQGHWDYSVWVSSLSGEQLQHLKKVSYYCYLHLFRRFTEACRKSIERRQKKYQGVNFYSERLRLKALLSIRLWIKQRLEGQTQDYRADEHYQQTLVCKAFAALADSAFLAYTARLVLSSWRAQAKIRAVLKRYLRECRFDTLEVASTTARTSKNASEDNTSFQDSVYELTIE